MERRSAEAAHFGDRHAQPTPLLQAAHTTITGRSFWGPARLHPRSRHAVGDADACLNTCPDTCPCPDWRNAVCADGHNYIWPKLYTARTIHAAMRWARAAHRWKGARPRPLIFVRSRHAVGDADTHVCTQAPAPKHAECDTPGFPKCGVMNRDGFAMVNGLWHMYLWPI